MAVFLWAALYGLTYTVSGWLWRETGAEGWATALSMLAYAGLLVCWLSLTGRRKKAGLCAVDGLGPGGYLTFLPLFALPLCNLAMAGGGLPGLPLVVLMLGVSLVEEIFFRGFLLPLFAQRGRIFGILASSAAFALFHCVNLPLHGNLVYTLAQMLCAFAAGICFGAVFVRRRSLLPCWTAHFAVNVTGAAVSAEGAASRLPLLLICAAAYFCYGARLCRSIR